MKNPKVLCILALCAVISVSAQKIDVQSLTQIELTEAGGYFYPTFSPTGDYLLTTSENYAGLQQYDLNAQAFKVINQDAGAGYKPQISEDGQTILYRKTTFVDSKRMTALQSHSLVTNSNKLVIAPTREQITPQFASNKPTYIQGRKLIRPNVPTAELQAVIAIENQKMVLYTANGRKELTPNGQELSYYWPAVSPDGKKVVYTVAGKGTFVCRIDGTQVISLGKLNAPKWIDNTWLVGMDDKDDGHDIIASSLVAIKVDGKSRQEIAIPEDVMPMYPAVSKDSKRMAFNTPKGVVYLLQIQINQ